MRANRKLCLWLVVCGLFLLASITLVAVSINEAVSTQDRTNRQICVAFNRFNAVMTVTLNRSAVNLPKLAYFREHPDELAGQLDQIRQQIVQFRQRACR